MIAVEMLCVVETGMIHPPFGLNVFVLKGITPDVSLWTIYKGVTPFVVADLIKLVLMLLFPAIARAPMGPRLGAIVAQAHLAYFSMGAAVLLTAFVFPQYWILLLGKQYESMTSVVWMVFLASIVMNASGFAFRTLSVRGATAGQTYSIPVTLITQVLYLWLVGVSDLRSVLGFGIATSMANFGYQYALLAVRWMEWRKDRPVFADSQARL